MTQRLACFWRNTISHCRLLTLLLLLPTFSAHSQTILNAADLCAARKQQTLAPPAGPDLRSDSVDILHTHVDLKILPALQKLEASAFLQITPKVNGLKDLRFDLLGFNVSEVSASGAVISKWSHDGKQLFISFLAGLDVGDTLDIRIDYAGQPAQDASTWGGFYWQNGYAYNLGVGFDADPHSYGRSLFPCFDNFVERCTFSFDVTAPADKPAYSNGILTADLITAGGESKRRWELKQSIPSYLACVASGPFTSFKRTYQGELGPVPVEIAVAPGDSTKLKNSFVHLPDALAAFEHWFGPYRWDKIGYSVVPFNQGAMEHATNIAYMRSAVDGATGSERLFAHELSHHWWGDLATCSTAEDMWLNEGWASFSEHLFLEWVYGPARYRAAVEEDFLKVLQNTHINEGGYRAVSGLPHALTYSDHVYHKGACVAHSLRGYLGDDLFRQGLRKVLNDNQFDDWSSTELRDKLGAATNRNLDDFFKDWVFSPGFSHFSVDSFRLETPAIDTYLVCTVFVKQKLRGAPHFYQNVPLEFTFLNDQWQRQTLTALVSGENSTAIFHFPLGFVPKQVWLNTNLRLTLARADKEKVVQTLGTISFTPAKMDVKINVLPDSALIRVENHFAMPDTTGAANPNAYRLSNRYWTVSGFLPPGFDATATVLYDGRGKLDQLDTELFAQTSPKEDSIILLYRPGPGHAWLECPDYFKNPLGITTDRLGQLRANHLALGEYTIAKGATTVSSAEPPARLVGLSLSPNPTSGMLRITAEETFTTMQVFHAGGDLVREQKTSAVRNASLQLSDLPAGAYWLVVHGEKGSGVASFVKQ